MGDTVVAVYHRPPDQKEEVDEVIYRQLKVASQSQALVLEGDFNHPDICWKHHTARHTQSGRLLKTIDANFFTQVLGETMKRGMLLDLALTNRDGLVEELKAGESLGCSDHEMMEFRILHRGSRAISRITTLDFKTANLVSSRTYLEKSRGSGLSKAGGSKRAGRCLNITSSMLRIGASP